MCRFDRLLLLAALSGGAHAAPWEDLGEPLTATEISSWDIDVRPDGLGLPKGRGSVADGQAIYDAQCANCHGVFGESNDYIALTGGIGSLASETPQRTVASKLDYATTLWDYINRAMPFPHSKTLTADEVYAVTAYVLNLAEILPLDAVIDETSLPAVKMPNRDGFTTDHGFMAVAGIPDVKATDCQTDCAGQAEITSTLPEGFTTEMYGDIRTHFRALAGVTTLPSDAAVVASGPAGPGDLAAGHGCLACHGRDRALVGPAFTSIAARYHEDPAAAATLASKVREGGSGVWGSAMMPPQTGIPAADLDTVIRWILAGATP